MQEIPLNLLTLTFCAPVDLGSICVAFAPRNENVCHFFFIGLPNEMPHFALVLKQVPRLWFAPSLVPPLPAWCCRLSMLSSPGRCSMCVLGDTELSGFWTKKVVSRKRDTLEICDSLFNVCVEGVGVRKRVCEDLSGKVYNEQHRYSTKVDYNPRFNGSSFSLY